ncbi:hypothetical protein E2C01_075544 [Portunus trituberculatus]|uniref:Uncharacterized protein n=1 Tax=Portunus trituberculatus TaxID=210409 RepID=A0A5B7IG37_PORTR|nr:hypothetical protein [Portunus trituberculatus]
MKDISVFEAQKIVNFSIASLAVSWNFIAVSILQSSVNQPPIYRHLCKYKIVTSRSLGSFDSNPFCSIPLMSLANVPFSNREPTRLIT